MLEYLPEAGRGRPIDLRFSKTVGQRGRHDGEHMAIGHHIPCISSCVGATEYIANGQVVVVDAGRGEVYDALLLQELL